MNVIEFSNTFFLVLLAATTTLYAANPAGAASPPARSVGDASSSTVESLAAQGATAFKDGQFKQSLGFYRQAAQGATRPEEHAALTMNMGACLVELGRLAEAKVMFLRTAESWPGVAQKARLNAALIAVEMGQLDEAETLVAAARPIDEALLPREQDIKARIAEKRATVPRAELQANIDAAAKAIARADWKVAEKSLLEAQVHFDVAEPSERVDVLNGLATVQLALERPDDARVSIDAALALSPDDHELYYARARAYEALGQRADARADYRRALAFGLKESQAKNARTSIEELDPLSSSKFYGWLSASVGYDSNPRQSGAATETTLGRRDRGDSGYGRFVAELGRSQRIHERVSLNLRYAGDWLGMQEETVRDLSLQSHGVSLETQWAPTDRLVLGLELGPSVTYIGMSEVSLFNWDFTASMRARYRASDVRTWRVAFDVRRITGSTDWAFLSGTRLDAELSHSWHYRPLDLRLGIRGRDLTIGSRTTVVDATVITACAGVCDGAEYQIPLSYIGFGPIGSVRLALDKSLHVAMFGQVDLRRYQDESYIVGIDASRKHRVDFRYNLGVDLRWSLDKNEHIVVVPSYALLISSSNIAQSTTQIDHFYDYDDRSFVQHFFEVGVEANF